MHNPPGLARAFAGCAAWLVGGLCVAGGGAWKEGTAGGRGGTSSVKRGFDNTVLSRTRIKKKL